MSLLVQASRLTWKLVSQSDRYRYNMFNFQNPNMNAEALHIVIYKNLYICVHIFDM